MQTIHINDNQELQKAKNLIFYSILIGILAQPAGLFFAFIISAPSISTITSSIAFIASIVALVGYYQFSKLCNTFIFRLMIFNILLTIVAYSLVFVCVFSVASMRFERLDTWYIPAIIASVIFIAYIAIEVYWGYLMCYELAARTGQREFITSFKLFCIGFTLLVLAVGLFLLPVIDYLYMSFYLIDNLTGTIQGISAYILLVIAMLVAIAALVFFILGIYRIKEVTIREVNQIRLEK